MARIQLLHPTKTAPTVEQSKYDAVRRAILAALPTRGAGLPFRALATEVGRRMDNAAFGSGSVGWYTTTVKLDLEARGLIRRVPGRGTQHLIRVDTPR